DGAAERKRNGTRQLRHLQHPGGRAASGRGHGKSSEDLPMTGEEPKAFKVEEVNEAPPPPERPVPPRQVDFIESFLKEEKPAVSAEEPGGDLYDRVLEALRSIYDPEIPVNIYDLGLIYG